MRKILLLVGATVLASVAGLAQAAEVPGGTVAIQSGRISGAGGVNAAAGSFNQQLNAGAIALGDIAVAVPEVVQRTDQAPDSAGALAASIAPGSFAGSSGWLAVNGAAGSGNQQANIAAIAFGTTGAALADTALSQTRAPHGPAGSSGKTEAAANRSTAIGEGAFADSSGLVQVSLIGGDRNSSANTFALSISEGAQH